MSELPISCVRCRRRKIKCNKRKPCNQCVKHGVPCQFPSKFRNVSFDEGPEASLNGPCTADPAGAANPALPASVCELEQQVRRLQLENQYIREEFQRHTQRPGDSDLDPGPVSDWALSPAHPFHIRGETTENGEKYYGPLLANNMTEDFDKIASGASGGDPGVPLQHHRWTSDPFRIADSDGDGDSDASSGSRPHNAHTQPLPWLVDPAAHPAANVRVIKALVHSFFETKAYDYFISEARVVRAVDEHACGTHLDGAGDGDGGGDLLLLHMVLMLALQRLGLAQYNGLFRPAVAGFAPMWRATRSVQKRLFRGFSRLRHNLANESYVTVQAYILCAEWEFVEQRYEEAWAMMFHCCAIAYALGLHVVSKATSLLYEPQAYGDKQAPPARGLPATRSKDGYDDFYADELPKLRVWFALRNLCSQMCLILGRPNPIMVQVNHVSLPVASTCNVEDARALDSLTSTLLKLGLSECVRLSNSNMIDSFLAQLSMDSVWAINAQFGAEIDKLSYYLGLLYQAHIDGVVKKIDPLTDMPATVTRRDVLVDLVVLHVNRVKLLQPSVARPVPHNDALNYIMGSILLFYEHTCELVSEFVKDEVPRILECADAAGAAAANAEDIRLDKVFVFRDPFFASFIYQGMVVTYILISTKAHYFIQESSGAFVDQLEALLHTLLGLHSSIAKLVRENIHLWSRSNLILMRKILDNIAIMKQASKARAGSGALPTFSGFDYDPQIGEMLGINMRDPFWVGSPENSPHFLGILAGLGAAPGPKLRVPGYIPGLQGQLFGPGPIVGHDTEYSLIQTEADMVGVIDIDADGGETLGNSHNPHML
ncbi:hypothetical protein METBIDRAFT_10783 [Metschnikowia bicuspidata var. bicuspidata NRRL YB-4993]|uniref:Zn(2)-C6 fungal-type domain-containing protein n=1 Tax=Metschnikowia bicuspidata var. bicuspidata NRRL YB-4993 TaxID=869754 RepID=A0A1A0HD07_9ASCO|nr:hypothetical protein METBIDRAFT_10783 [Metschnikowia bicuspidata var. bicuspidata NRRL YB-4993]OBA21860.1 hypothetical protein METBIDRAFT_10783 [Metschnikowia bicuspidata var. bicuspidata NRRL YB-4993]